MRFNFAFAVILCTGCTRSPPPCVVGAGRTQTYVVNHLTLPQSKADFAIDLNGDGKPDNQLGNIIGALTGVGFDATPM